MYLQRAYIYLILWFIVLSYSNGYSPNEYKIIPARMECTNINFTLGNLQCYNHKFKRNERSFGFKIKFNQRVDKMECIFKAYLKHTNSFQYNNKIYQTRIDICNALRFKSFGVGIKFKLQGNFSGCPFEKGIYTVDNLIVNEHKLPSFAPSGEYMAETELYIGKSLFSKVINYYNAVEVVPVGTRRTYH